MCPTAPRLWMLLRSRVSFQLQGDLLREVRDRNVQLPLRDQCTGSDHRVLSAGRILDDDDVVAALGEHGVELLLEVGLGNLTDGGQDTQAVEEAAGIVCPAQGAQLVALGEVGRDIGGD
jgi:hypothetical protein